MSTIVWVKLEFEGPDAEDHAADVVNGLLDMGTFQEAIGDAAHGAGYTMALTSAIEIMPTEDEARS